jgi:hypothetical protein
MELPTEVLIHNEQMGMKGTPGTLLQIMENGYYELNCRFGGNTHRVLLPVGRTALIAKEPEPPPAEGLEIVR